MKDYIIFESKIGLNSNSYRTSIPRELIELLELSTDHKIVWQFNIKTYELSLSFKNIKNTSSNIDETIKKQQKKEVTINTTAESSETSNKKEIFQSETSTNQKYKINLEKYKNKDHKQITIYRTSDNKQVTFLGTKDRSDDEIQQIINDLTNKNSDAEIKKYLKEYRPK